MVRDAELRCAWRKNLNDETSAKELASKMELVDGAPHPIAILPSGTRVEIKVTADECVAASKSPASRTLCSGSGPESEKVVMQTRKTGIHYCGASQTLIKFARLL